ncbi:MAG: helix-turn-helix transcriptional regulator [Deltaproteobacteria bacterium]
MEKSDQRFNIRRLSEEKRREFRSTITERLAGGEYTLGEAVRIMRLAAGLTQKQYATMTGVDIRVLAGIERGEGNPRLDTLEKLAQPYGFVVSFIHRQ